MLGAKVAKRRGKKTAFCFAVGFWDWRAEKKWLGGDMRNETIRDAPGGKVMQCHFYVR